MQCVVKRICKLTAILLVVTSTAAIAAPVSQETIWYGSARSSSTAWNIDSDTLSANVTMLRECLKEHKGRDRESCVGVTKSYCSAEQPTCNIEEAAAWNSLGKKYQSQKSQLASLRQSARSCGYVEKDEGYAGINPRDPWADRLAPSGCVLQRAAHRYLHSGGGTVHHKKTVAKKATPKPVVQVEPAQTVATTPANAPATVTPPAPAAAPVVAPAPYAAAAMPTPTALPVAAPQPAVALPVVPPAASTTMPPLPTAHQ